METMKVTICQMSDEIAEFKQDWMHLIVHTQIQKARIGFLIY